MEHKTKVNVKRELDVMLNVIKNLSKSLDHPIPLPRSRELFHNDHKIRNNIGSVRSPIQVNR